MGHEWGERVCLCQERECVGGVEQVHPTCPCPLSKRTWPAAATCCSRCCYQPRGRGWRLLRRLCVES